MKLPATLLLPAPFTPASTVMVPRETGAVFSGMGGRAAGIHGGLAQRLGGGGKERSGGAFRLGRIHPGDHLIELGGEAFERGAATLLEFLIVRGAFGVTPLYINEEDVVTAAQTLERVMRGKLWDRSEYRTRSKVT